MQRDGRLLFGPLATLILLAGLVLLPLFVPGYSVVHQTVSEIGEMDSPMRWPFAAMLGLVAASLIVFALGLRAASRRAGHNAVSAYLTAWMAMAAAGIGWFAFPHPLHNVFGLSELIGYQAPIAFAIAWRRDVEARDAVRFSWLMYGLVCVSLALNLSTLDRDGALFTAIRPFYGLVQRSLFACFFLWAAGTGWLLYRGSNAER